MLQNVATMSIKRRVSMHSRPALPPVDSVGAVGNWGGMSRVAEKDGEITVTLCAGYKFFKTPNANQERGLDPEGAIEGGGGGA